MEELHQHNKSPRNKREVTRKHMRRDSARTSKIQHGITHRLIRCTDLNSVGSTGVYTVLCLLRCVSVFASALVSVCP